MRKTTDTLTRPVSGADEAKVSRRAYLRRESKPTKPVSCSQAPLRHSNGRSSLPPPYPRSRSSFILSQERGSSAAPALSRPSLKEATL